VTLLGKPDSGTHFERVADCKLWLASRGVRAINFDKTGKVPAFSFDVFAAPQ
jgi:hypothetical protein